MNPIIEQWFEELDEGGEDLKGFIRQTSDVILSEMGIPPQLVKYLQDRNLALIPLSRLWWDNPPSKLFGAVSPRHLTPPGHVEASTAEEEAEEAYLGERGVEEVTDFREKLRGNFIEGALESIAVGQPVYYMTEPFGPMRQQDTGVGIVESVHKEQIIVKTQEGKKLTVDLGAGGRVTLRR